MAGLAHVKRENWACAVGWHRVQMLQRGWQAWREALALGYLKQQREALAGHHRYILVDKLFLYAHMRC